MTSVMRGAVYDRDTGAYCLTGLPGRYRIYVQAGLDGLVFSGYYGGRRLRLLLVTVAAGAVIGGLDVNLGAGAATAKSLGQ